MVLHQCSFSPSYINCYQQTQNFLTTTRTASPTNRPRVGCKPSVKNRKGLYDIGVILGDEMSPRWHKSPIAVSEQKCSAYFKTGIFK